MSRYVDTGEGKREGRGGQGGTCTEKLVFCSNGTAVALSGRFILCFSLFFSFFSFLYSFFCLIYVILFFSSNICVWPPGSFGCRERVLGK